MEINKRIQTARELERKGSIRIGKDIIISHGNYVYVKTENPPRHLYYGYVLSNPMTWDTFTHLYLLDK